jgi:hypothetical protein
MDQQIFTDGIARITVIGGVVRLDLVTYSPNETDAQGKPRQIFTQRVVMGTEAFLRSAEKVREIIEQLAHPGAHIAPAQKQPAPTQPTQAAQSARPPSVKAQAQAQPQPNPAPKGEPPYTTGPLFPPTPDKPAISPFP